MTTVAIIQSSYVPWKGYFDIIADSDVFVFYDDAQYTARDWRNRNKLKGEQGTFWMTVPVDAPARDARVCDVALAGDHWASQHWKTIAHYYGKAPHFARYEAFLREAYLERRWTSLSALNQHLITTIAREFLGLRTEFVDATTLDASGRQQARLLDMLGKLEATRYISGPAARAYIEPAGFEAAGVELLYKDYSGYPVYPQFHGAFEHGVSIIDLLMHVGDQAPAYIWGWRDASHVTRVVPAAEAPVMPEASARTPA